MKYIRKNLGLILLILLFTLNIFIWYAVFSENHNGTLTVAFLDVGQGDAIFIEAPNGNQVLVDGGPNKSVLRQLGSVMPFYDRSIDMIVATHPDKDHVSGLLDVLNKFNVSIFMNSNVESRNSVYNAIVNLAKKNKVKRIIAKRGERILLGGGAYIDILFPDRDTSGWETNTASIVARLVYGNTSFLLTGDSPKKIEEYMSSIDGEKLSASVLKLGHHGSRTSSSAIFLSAVNPQIAIISAGKNNRYGHPHKEVVDMLKEFQIPTLATYKRGTIVIKSDGENIYVK
jgi:competence protein ComEC